MKMQRLVDPLGPKPISVGYRMRPHPEQVR